MSLGEQTAALEVLADVGKNGSAAAAAWTKAFLQAKPRE
jgi:hypothetical protein